MTINTAQIELTNSAKLTDDLHMTVYTLFTQDLITDQVNMSRVMFSSATEAYMWYQTKISFLKKLKVPFAIYLYDTLEASSGNLKFNEFDF